MSKGVRKKHYQFTAIDDCTRIRVLRIYDRLNQTTSIRFVDYVLEKLPFAVEVIQTDNGAEFQSRFHYHVLDAGIGHRRGRSGRRRGRGWIAPRDHGTGGGSTQVTLDGHPLYYFAADETPDDLNGQGVGDVWYVVSPEGEAIQA